MAKGCSISGVGLPMTVAAEICTVVPRVVLCKATVSEVLRC